MVVLCTRVRLIHTCTLHALSCEFKATHCRIPTDGLYHDSDVLKIVTLTRPVGNMRCAKNSNRVVTDAQCAKNSSADTCTAGEV